MLPSASHFAEVSLTDVAPLEDVRHRLNFIIIIIIIIIIIMFTLWYMISNVLVLFIIALSFDLRIGLRSVTFCKAYLEKSLNTLIPNSVHGMWLAYININLSTLTGLQQNINCESPHFITFPFPNLAIYFRISFENKCDSSPDKDGGSYFVYIQQV